MNKLPCAQHSTFAGPLSLSFIFPLPLLPTLFVQLSLCSHFALFASGLCSRLFLLAAFPCAALGICEQTKRKCSICKGKAERFFVCNKSSACSLTLPPTTHALERERGSGREEDSRRCDRVFHFSPSSIECTAAAAAAEGATVCGLTECD